MYCLKVPANRLGLSAYQESKNFESLVSKNNHSEMAIFLVAPHVHILPWPLLTPVVN